jgi:hypothetical protein
MTRKQKVIRSSFKMFLNWCNYYDVAVIRFFYDTVIAQCTQMQ